MAAPLISPLSDLICVLGGASKAENPYRGGKNAEPKGVNSRPGAVLGGPGLACGVHTLDEELGLVVVNFPYSPFQ